MIGSHSFCLVLIGSGWFSSPNVIQVIKSRRKRWAGQVTYKGERRGADRVLGGDLKERNYLEQLGKEGRTHLQEIGREWAVLDSSISGSR